jgi:proteic killer suppression protein
MREAASSQSSSPRWRWVGRLRHSFRGSASLRALHGNRLLLLEIAFQTRELRNLCEKERVAQRQLGRAVAEKLKNRLADIIAAEQVDEVIAGSPKIKGKLRDRIEINLGGGIRLVVCSNHHSPAVTKDGRVDWLHVSRLKVVHIGPGDEPDNL